MFLCLLADNANVSWIIDPTTSDHPIPNQMCFLPAGLNAMLSAMSKAMLRQRIAVACESTSRPAQYARSLSIFSSTRAMKDQSQDRSDFGASRTPRLFAPYVFAVRRKFSSSAQRTWMNEELYKSKKVSVSMKLYQFLKMEGPKNRVEIYEEFKELVDSKSRLTHILCRMKDKKQLITQRDPRLPMGKKARFVYSIRREVDKASFLHKRGLKFESTEASTEAAVALEPDLVEISKQN